MDIPEQIKAFEEFFDIQEIKLKIINYANKGRKWVKINFSDIVKHNIDLAESLLDNPEETFKIAEIALEDISKGKHIRIFNLPTTQQRHIWQVRQEDIGKFIALKGIINKSSSIIHLCESAKFECFSCGNVMVVMMLDGKYKEPNKCVCGRQGKFKLVDKTLIDTIKLGLIDDLMDIENVDRSVAREKLAILSKDLTSKEIDQQIKPGKKVILNGYFTYVQTKGVEFGSVFTVNSIEFVKIGWDTINITKEEETKIKKLAQEDNIIVRLAESIADVVGFREVKIASLLQLAGAPNMYDKNRHLTSRGTIHILLIGSPGCQPASSKVMLADGRWKNIEDIKIGDEVLSPQEDGSYKHAKVKNTTNWYSNKNYDVVQLNRHHRKLYTCSYNHKIPVHHKVKPRFKGKRHRGLYYWDYATYESEAFSNLHKGTKTRMNVGFSSFLIPKFKDRINCKIEPYTLGIYLGDGSFTINKYKYGKGSQKSRALSITTMDHQIMEEISKHYPLRDIRAQKNNKSKMYYFSLKGTLSKQLSHYGLEGLKSKYKFIPKEALYSDSDYRLKLLAGLIDSDGTFKNGGYVISTGSKQLAEDIIQLVYSLGGRGNIRNNYIIYKGQRRKYYGVSFYLGSLRPPILCERKQKKCNEIYVSSDRVAIDSILSKPGYVYGFELDSPSGWYITDNYMVTHNSSKTYLIKRAGAISPIFSFQCAATASGRGLVASVNKDPDMDSWAIYPGVVVMAHKGIVGLDEIDKTHKDDYGDHNSAMNDMRVFIAKSNVKGILDTETSYLATANPENRVFTQYEPYYSQIDMPKDFLDRFDIIIPMESPLEEEGRDRIADTMLNRLIGDDVGKWQPEFTHKFIRRYVAYCRRSNPSPKITKELFAFIKQKLHDLMKPKDDAQMRISFRQLESIWRFAYASARLRLRDVTEEDVSLAFDLKRKSFMELGIIDKSGGFSWAKLEDIDEQKISDKEIIKQVLRELLPNPGAMVPWHDIINKCNEKGIAEDIVEEYIDKLKHRGDYYEPRRGWLRRM